MIRIAFLRNFGLWVYLELLCSLIWTTWHLILCLTREFSIWKLTDPRLYRLALPLRYNQTTLRGLRPTASLLNIRSRAAKIRCTVTAIKREGFSRFVFWSMMRRGSFSFAEWSRFRTDPYTCAGYSCLRHTASADSHCGVLEYPAEGVGPEAGPEVFQSVIETDPFPRCFPLFPQIQRVNSSLFSQICGVVHKGNSKSTPPVRHC